MPIAPYDRSRLPPGLDHSGYGRPCKVFSLFDLGASRSFSRTVTRLPDERLPASRVFDAAGEASDVPRHLQACGASFQHAFTEPCGARLFMPDHGALVRDGEENAIMLESLWHDELFFSGSFRNDASTEWQWRIDENWSHSIRRRELVNHCYHRFHYQYFHWMMDCLPRVWMLRKYANRGHAKWLVGPLGMPFHLPTLELFGIGAEDCLPLPYGSITSFENLVIPAFMFQEPLKTLRPDYGSGVHHIGWSTEYIDDVRRLAWDRHGGSQELDLRLYVSRGGASHRHVRNEAEVLGLLSAHGFLPVEPGTLSFARQVELFSRASVVVGPHGAGMTNLMWARPPCEILEFAPDGLPDAGYRFMSNLCGHRHSLISCLAFSHPQGVAYADLEVDVTALRHALGHLSLGRRIEAGTTGAVAPASPNCFHEIEQESFHSTRPAEESLAMHDYPEALRQALVYSARHPGNGWGWLILGRAYRMLGDSRAMRTALNRTLSLADADPHVGAAFELLLAGAVNADFSDQGLIDFALSQAQGSGQERWYKGRLLFVKALALLHEGAFAQADQALRQAYAYRADTDEMEFLFPWVLAKLAERDMAVPLPYLAYLARRTDMGMDRIDYQAALDAQDDDAVVLEIGAMDGVGHDALHRSLMARPWKAILVEPTRDMFDRLALNYRDRPDVRCVRVAISSRTGHGEMHRIDPEAVASGQVGEWALGVSALSLDGSLKFYEAMLRTEEVDTLTFADFVALEKVDRIDVLQIDTEGHDFIIFDQIDFDRYSIGLLHIELINLDPADRLTIFHRLESRGYRCHYDGADLTAVR